MFTDPLAALCVLALAAAPAAPAGHAPEPPPVASGVTLLSPWFEALASTEQGRRADPARIGWWGDSAIVGDGYTGEVRRRLQARFGDGGPGFILAAPAFDGYLRHGVRLKRHTWETESVLTGPRRDGRYGYGGVIASSWGGAGSTFILEDGLAPIDRVEVWHHAGPNMGGLQLYLDEAAKAAGEVACAADAGSDRIWAPPIGAPARHLRLRAAGGGLVQVYGVVLERAGPGVVLDALGIVGLRARRWTKHADAAHVRGQIAARRPDLLVLNFGGNERVDPGLSEARHADEIAAVAAVLRAGHPGAACLIVGPIAHGQDGTTRLDPALETIYAGQRAAAERAGCAFFDTTAAMGGAEAVSSFRQRKLLGRDLAHLNPAGHRELGRLVATWLVGAYDAWRGADAGAAAPPTR